ncbi:MAG: hypothetical protein ACLTS1_06865 [Coprococcus sp.]
MLDKVWWTHIIKAHKFEEDIVKAAAEGKSVLLSLPENVPWKKHALGYGRRAAETGELQKRF